MGITAGAMMIVLAISGGLPEIMWMGNSGMSGSVSSAGMGNTWFADNSPQGALENPAMAAELSEGFFAGVTGYVALDIEKRTRRVYDSFGGVVGESEDSFNQNFTPFPGGAALSWSDGTFSAAGGWRAVATFEYNYSKVINDNNYVEVAQEFLEFSGLLNEFALSAAWDSGNTFFLGAGGGILTGTRSAEYSVAFADPSVTDIDTDSHTDMSGSVVRGSAGARAGRVTVTAGVEQVTGIKLETGGSGITGTVSNDVTVPVKVKAGAVYTPGNRLMSVFAADFWWSPTSSVEIDDTDAGLRNSWGFGAGVENTLPGNLIARAGFEYDSSPISSALDRMGFTAGLGWIHDELAVDAALGFSPVRWDQQAVEWLPAFMPADTLVVEESRTILSLGLTRTF
ncbi:hypothetical protein CSA37_04480 [Candidatus Fermentibacteria bacterium]|nr:MAG: hypothetical protein CSA37_04480 [Candidatus Fermentibacteria bacterium]